MSHFVFATSCNSFHTDIPITQNVFCVLQGRVKKMGFLLPFFLLLLLKATVIQADSEEHACAEVEISPGSFILCPFNNLYIMKVWQQFIYLIFIHVNL